MGFHYTERVYTGVKGTSPLEQSVLVALAHRADDKTGRCFPSHNTIQAMTHMSWRSIFRVLNKLRDMDLLDWNRGGRIQGGGGRSRANDYTLKLPPAKKAAPAKPPETPRSMDDLPEPTATSTSPKHSVADDSCRQPPPKLGEGGKRIEGLLSDVEASGKPPPKRGEGVKLIGELLGNAEALVNQLPPQEIPLEQVAMDAAGVTDEENRAIFESVLHGRDREKCIEVIKEFDINKKKGRLRNVQSLPKLLTSQLKAIPRLPK